MMAGRASAAAARDGYYFVGEIRRSSSKKFKMTTTLSRFPPSSG